MTFDFLDLKPESPGTLVVGQEQALHGAAGQQAPTGQIRLKENLVLMSTPSRNAARGLGLSATA